MNKHDEVPSDRPNKITTSEIIKKVHRIVIYDRRVKGIWI